jgi:aspartate/methionine/tyrosine aminotransferase
MYLSVGTPVQQAVGTLLQEGPAVRAQIRDRLDANHRRLIDTVRAHPSCRLLPVEGGWYAVIQVPAIQSEDSLVVRLVEEERILVHPGYFFDFPREAYVIVSLLPEPETFGGAIATVLRRAEHG